MKWFAFLLLSSVLCAGETGRIYYSKSFPGSTPALTIVTLAPDGAVEYREAADDDQPIKFQLSSAETGDIFSLAAKLDYFKRPLESPLKVAFMGNKTFRYENGATKNEVKFNFSEDADARAIQDWFERISESAQHRIELERTAKYDRLGVVRALLLLASAMERNRVVGQEQYLPILDRIAKNESYMHTARARASEIAEAIRHPQPKP